MLVDTQGLVLKVHVTAANIPDRQAARPLLASLKAQFPRMQIVWADQGYNGDLGEWMLKHLGWHLEIVARTTKEEHHEKMWAIARKRQQEGASVVQMWAGLSYGRGIEVLPKRWVVERTFAWLSKCRRLCRDYEFVPQSSEAMIYIAMTRLMLKRLGKNAQQNTT